MTTFYPANLAFSNGQLAKLNRAIKSNQAVTLRLKPENLSGPRKIFLTQMQINKLRKANSKGVGMDLRISKNQIRKATGGSLFALAAEVKALLPTAAKALGLAGFSFGAEKALKTIFGSGFPPEAVELYRLVKKLSPIQKKGIRDVLVLQGQVGTGQRGGFLGMLASLGIPLAIELVKKVIGKGLHLERKGVGMRLEPPQPFYGSWDTSSLPYRKKIADKPLSNFDLWEWCGRKIGEESLSLHNKPTQFRRNWNSLGLLLV